MLPNQVATAPGASKKYPNLASTLFVNNIDSSINKNDLSNLFCRYGTVLSITLTKDPSPNIKSYAFVVFDDVKQAEIARQKFQYYKLGNSALIVMYAGDKTKFKQEGKIFIKNIPAHVSHIQLHQLFATISPDLVVHIASDEKYKNVEAYGYAHYFNPEDATKALETLQSHELGGGKLELSPWVSKDDRRLPQSQEKKGIYVGNIPLDDKDTVDSAVRSLFAGFGEIEALTLKRSEKAGFYSAIVTLKNPEDAEKAYDNLTKNPIGLLGSQEPLYLNWHMTREERSKAKQKEGKDNLYLRNLKMSVTEQDLRDLFGIYGEIKAIEIRVWNDPKMKGDLQFAFVSYKEPEDAEKALDYAASNPAIQNLFSSKSKIYIRFFMSKNEREQEVKKVKQTQSQMLSHVQQQKASAPSTRARRAEPATVTRSSNIKTQMPQIPQMAPMSQMSQNAMYPSYPIHNPIAAPMYTVPMYSHAMASPPMSSSNGMMMYQPFQANQPLNKNMPFGASPMHEKMAERKMVSKGSLMKRVATKEEEHNEKKLKKKSEALPTPPGLSRATSKPIPASSTLTSKKEVPKMEVDHDEEVQMIIESNQYDDAQKQAILAKIFENKQDKPFAKY